MNLVVESDPIQELVWKPAAADTTRSVREGLRSIAREPRVRCVEVRIDSGHPDSHPNGGAAVAALKALIQLGCPMAEARMRRDTAWARLLQTGESAQAIDAERLLREALRLLGP